MPTADAIASGVVGNATTDGPALFLYSRLFNANGHAAQAKNRKTASRRSLEFFIQPVAQPVRFP